MIRQVNPETITAPPTLDGGQGVLAIIVRAHLPSPQVREKGVHFWTQDRDGLQVGTMIHKAGHKVLPHQHRAHRRLVESCEEVLFVRSGRLRAQFYTSDGQWWTCRDLAPGDVCVLVSGGHGFEWLEDGEVFEVKQGPYMGQLDKTYITDAPEVSSEWVDKVLPTLTTKSGNEPFSDHWFGNT